MKKIHSAEQHHSNIKVSVIVTTYRREEYLYRALLSVAEQTYPNIEIIIVDDNAQADWNDKVRFIVGQVRDHSDFPVKCIVNPENCGSAASRNIGIAAAVGLYITFLDDDDVYLPDKIEKQLNDMLQVNADYGITDLYLYNQKDELTDKRIRWYIEDTDKDSLLRYHAKYHMTGTDTFMFKTDYLRAIGGFLERDVGDEFYLMERAILGNGMICYSEHCCVKAYVHTGSETGLSSGQGKIDGENMLYREKKKYFNMMTYRDRRYIAMRHYAVLAFAYFRAGQYVRFFANGMHSFLISPVNCIRLLQGKR